MGKKKSKLGENQKTLLEQMPRSSAEELLAAERKHVSAKHYEAIGRTIAEWAYFEHQISSWTIKLGRIHPVEVGICLTAQMQGPARKMQALLAIARHQKASQESIDELVEISKCVTSTAERRNRVAHDPWEQSEDGTFEQLFVEARGEVKMKWKVIPISKLQNYQKMIIRLSERLQETCARIDAELSP